MVRFGIRNNNGAAFYRKQNPMDPSTSDQRFVCDSHKFILEGRELVGLKSIHRAEIGLDPT